MLHEIVCRSMPIPLQDHRIHSYRRDSGYIVVAMFFENVCESALSNIELLLRRMMADFGLWMTDWELESHPVLW